MISIFWVILYTCAGIALLADVVVVPTYSNILQYNAPFYPRAFRHSILLLRAMTKSLAISGDTFGQRCQIQLL